MRLIDADILDEALTSLRFTADGKLAHWGDRKDWCLHGSEIEMLIANAPTVEVEPIRHGEWIDMGDFEQCSVCQGTHLKEVNTMYGEAIWIKSARCPNCGAHMDKGEADT